MCPVLLRISPYYLYINLLSCLPPLPFALQHRFIAPIYLAVAYPTAHHRRGSKEQILDRHIDSRMLIVLQPGSPVHQRPRSALRQSPLHGSLFQQRQLTVTPLSLHLSENRAFVWQTFSLAAISQLRNIVLSRGKHRKHFR